MRLDNMRLDNVSPRTWLLATLAGWALLLWLLALLGMGGHVAPLADDPALVQSLAAAATFATDRDSARWRNTPRSVRARCSPMTVAPSRSRCSPKAKTKPRRTTFDYVLTSVLITPGLHMAIVQPTAGGDSVRIKLGESAEAAAAWRLVDAESAQRGIRRPRRRKDAQPARV